VIAFLFNWNYILFVKLKHSNICRHKNKTSFLQRIIPVLIVLVLLLSACRNIFAPTLADLPGGNSIYRLDLASPADVLHNFRYAYIYRDSLMYANLLDSEFVFVYFQPSTESGTGHYDSWMRDTELRATGRLLGAFNYIDLLWQTTLDSAYYTIEDEVIVREESGWFEEANYADISKSYQLTLGDYYTLIGDASFRFRKDADGKWRILRWEDKFNSY
jgi:hypothetical protein